MEDTTIKRLFGAGQGPAVLTDISGGGGEITNDHFLHKTRPTKNDLREAIALYLNNYGIDANIAERVSGGIAETLSILWEDFLQEHWDEYVKRYEDAHDAAAEFFFMDSSIEKIMKAFIDAAKKVMQATPSNQDKDWRDAADNAFEHLPLGYSDAWFDYIYDNLDSIITEARSHYPMQLPSDSGYEDPVFAGAVDLVQNIMLRRLYEAGIIPKTERNGG